MKEYKKPVSLSSSNIYLVQKGSERITIRQGMTKEEVRNILGEPLAINHGNNPRNSKFLFKFSENGFPGESYEIFFREDYLEWINKIK